jgi:L-amino acid N-acyltransferase YncA
MTSISDRVRRNEELIAQYPLQRELRDGGAIELRLMSIRDEVRFLTFARSLPLDDLLYEQRDITDEHVVEEWLRNIRRGQALTVLAYRGDNVVGEASLEHSQSTWNQHRGEIRIVISPGARGQGLGRVLAREVFSLAKELKLQQLTAQMVESQNTAQSVFKELGFEPVAVLPGFAVDQKGAEHDIIVMMHDLSADESTLQRSVERSKGLLRKLRGASE